MSEAFTANTQAGSYTISASTIGASTPATFSLTNTASTAASIVAASGTPQSTTVNTAFGSALTATVDDAFGNPVPGVSVTFTAPSGGLFSNSTASIIGTTNVSGQVSEAFTASTQAGSYTVTASTGGVSPNASFSLTNTVSTPASIVPASGTPQSVTVNTAIGSAFVATVDDVFGNPVSGVTVMFTAPSSGATGVFSNSSNIIFGTTNASGQVSESFTASTTAGRYTVTASVSGVRPAASFSLTNTAATGASIVAASGTPQSFTVNTAFGSALVATVDDVYGNPVPGVSVTFTAPSSGAGGLFSNSATTISGVTNVSGQVSESFTANTSAGSYLVTASTSGASTPATFSLTNTASTPASIGATSGTPQGVTVNTAFGSSLGVTVDDQYGNPVSGVSVTLTAPSSGAGGLFSNSTATIIGTTNVKGQIFESFTANTSAGSYSVTAVANGVSKPATFSLTNTASTPASIAAASGTPQSTTVNTTFGMPLWRRSMMSTATRSRACR